MDQNTDTNTAGETARTFDHEAIASDLQGGLSVKDTVAKHGCSATLVHRIQKAGDGSEKLPRNARRAITLRRKSEQLAADITLLTRWKNNEATVTVKEGEPAYTGVTELLEAVVAIRDQCDIAAELYEELPLEAMKTRRVTVKVDFALGMVVRAKSQHQDTYKAICSSPDHLTVRGKRDTHVLVEDDTGSKFFVPAKELQVRTDA